MLGAELELPARDDLNLPGGDARQRSVLLAVGQVSICEVVSALAFFSSRFSLIDLPLGFLVVDVFRGLVTHGVAPSSGTSRLRVRTLRRRTAAGKRSARPSFRSTDWQHVRPFAGEGRAACSA